MHARILGPGDEAILMEAALADEELPPTLDRAHDLLADRRFVACVAFDDRDAVGLAYGHVLPQLTRTGLLLYSLGVAETHRRKGAARAMVDCLKRICAERGYYEMWVPTNAGNAAAMALYAACGGGRDDDDEAIFVFPTEE